MEKKTVRAGIVGAGFAARFHYEAMSKVYGAHVDVKGVYALDTQQAQAFAKERGIRCYESLDALLDDVDVVHCCVIVAAMMMFIFSEAFLMMPSASRTARKTAS